MSADRDASDGARERSRSRPSRSSSSAGAGTPEDGGLDPSDVGEIVVTEAVEQHVEGTPAGERNEQRRVEDEDGGGPDKSPLGTEKCKGGGPGGGAGGETCCEGSCGSGAALGCSFLGTAGQSCSPSAPPAASSSEEDSSRSGAAADERGQMDDEDSECPICYEPIEEGGAAMMCSGAGGKRHYFHARCLQQWINAARSSPTCPVCRGPVQINAFRLGEYLQGDESANLSAEDRSFLQTIADGLGHKNSWSEMTNLERASYAGGMLAAVASGFFIGWGSEASSRGRRSVTNRAGWEVSSMVLRNTSQEHQVAHTIGLMLGGLGRIITEIWRASRTARESSSSSSSSSSRREHSSC